MTEQRPPKSIRLPELEERLAFQVAKKRGKTFHGWVVGLIQAAIKRDPEARIVYFREREDQERTT